MADSKGRFGSAAGFAGAIGIGFAIYFILGAIGSGGSLLPYGDIVANADKNMFYKAVWFLMNFTEADFYAGVFASGLMIVGGIIAWRLSASGSSKAGFSICYGTNMFPWVLASQLLSLGIAIFVLGYTGGFEGGKYTWLPTFICVVGAPPAVMLLYGPSISALLTGSILGGLICFPVGFWMMTSIIPVLGVPGVVANVATMAITGIIINQVCHIAPWVKKVEYPKYKLSEAAATVSDAQRLQEMSKPSWLIRRVLADFTEAQFYGNEIAGALVITGVILDAVLTGHAAYASGAIGAIILSQFVGAAVGVYLYFDKYYTDGWYATFVPVVSIGPACVLMFGASIPVALFAGVLGGIIGGPMAEYFCKKLPGHIHPTVGNVTSMAVGTAAVSIVMSALPWF